jgi:hypothetical protein
MNSFVEDRFHPTRRDSSPGCDTPAISHARTLPDTAARIARELRDALRSDRSHLDALPRHLQSGQ